jgi:hypothetical protein
MQRHGTKGLMWGARGQFPPAVAMVVMFVLGRWFTSAHIYFRNFKYFIQKKKVLGLNYLDILKFRHHVPPPRLIFFLFHKYTRFRHRLDRSKSGLNGLDEFCESPTGNHKYLRFATDPHRCDLPSLLR